jgi:hypothetical protein
MPTSMRSLLAPLTNPAADVSNRTELHPGNQQIREGDARLREELGPRLTVSQLGHLLSRTWGRILLRTRIGSSIPRIGLFTPAATNPAIEAYA